MWVELSVIRKEQLSALLRSGCGVRQLSLSSMHTLHGSRNTTGLHRHYWRGSFKIIYVASLQFNFLGAGKASIPCFCAEMPHYFLNAASQSLDPPKTKCSQFFSSGSPDFVPSFAATKQTCRPNLSSRAQYFGGRPTAVLSNQPKARPRFPSHLDPLRMLGPLFRSDILSTSQVSSLPNQLRGFQKSIRVAAALREPPQRILSNIHPLPSLLNHVLMPALGRVVQANDLTSLAS